MISSPGKLRLLLAAISRRTPRVPLKLRTLRWLDRLLRSWNAESLPVNLGGTRFEVDTTDLIQFSLLYFGEHDEEVGRALAARLAGGGVLWDIGANIGAVSLPIAALADNIRVVAFEPSPRARRSLDRNLALNPGLTGRYMICPVALSDRSGKSSFFESNEPFNGGVGSLERAHNTVTEALTVDIARGDDLIDAGTFPAPDVIKIDVEGYELEVLRGLQRLLRSGADVSLVFEHEPYRQHARGSQSTGAIQELRDAGFEVRRLTATGVPDPVTLAMLGSHMNCIAQRP